MLLKIMCALPCVEGDRRAAKSITDDDGIYLSESDVCVL